MDSSPAQFRLRTINHQIRSVALLQTLRLSETQMKLTEFLLYSAICCFITFVCAGVVMNAQTLVISNDEGYLSDVTWKQSAQQVFFNGGKEGHWGRWLTVVRDPTTTEYGFLPSATFIYSRHKPIIRQLPKGYWGISFKD
jgi:hypothetical protein